MLNIFIVFFYTYNINDSIRQSFGSQLKMAFIGLNKAKNARILTALCFFPKNQKTNELVLSFEFISYYQAILEELFWPIPHHQIFLFLLLLFQSDWPGPFWW